VLEAVAPAAEPAAATSEPVLQAVESLSSGLAAATEPSAGAAETVAAAAEPVAEAAATLGAQAAEPVQAVGETAPETIAAASEPALQVPAATGAAADALATVGSVGVESVAAVSEGITDVAASPEQAAVPEAGAIGEPATDALATVGDVAAGIAEGLALPSDELASVLSASDEAVLSAAGAAHVAALVGWGVYASRTPAIAGCASSVQVLFTSVRLLPCLVSETIQRSLSSAAALRPDTIGRRHAGPSAHAPTANGRPQPILNGFVETFREGVARGTGRVSDGDGEAAMDSRLVMQIGMLLGVVYLAFLTVWFWATRLRWNPRI
jgi:hypothetical protein